MSIDSGDARDILNEFDSYGTKKSDVRFSPEDWRLYDQLRAEGYLSEDNGTIRRTKKELPYTGAEATYKETFDRVSPIIQDKIESAAVLLKQAEELAEQHGVPFWSSISRLGQNYVPRNMKSTGVSLKFIAEIADISSYSLEDGGYGWEHSAVC